MVNKEHAEEMRVFYERCYREEYGPEVMAVLNGGEPGNYDNNPTVEEYRQKGYKLIDANMFGDSLGSVAEIFIFAPR